MPVVFVGLVSSQQPERVILGKKSAIFGVMFAGSGMQLSDVLGIVGKPGAFPFRRYLGRRRRWPLAVGRARRLKRMLAVKAYTM